MAYYILISEKESDSRFKSTVQIIFVRKSTKLSFHDQSVACLTVPLGKHNIIEVIFRIIRSVSAFSLKLFCAFLACQYSGQETAAI